MMMPNLSPTVSQINNVHIHSVLPPAAWSGMDGLNTVSFSVLGRNTTGWSSSQGQTGPFFNDVYLVISC